jgi:UDP-N-acetylmuramoyl-tripeptide--D-alanyl-D-alanine ligase
MIIENLKKVVNILFPIIDFIILLQDTQDYNYTIYFHRLFAQDYGYFFKRNFIDKKKLRFSPRNWLTLLTSMAIIFIILSFSILQDWNLIVKIIIFILLLTLIPIIVAIGNLPTSIFRLYYIYIIKKYRAKIKRDGKKIIAITGSTGKTTTKEMLAQILSKQGSVLYTEKNYNSLWGNSKVLSQYKEQEYIVLEFAMDSPGHVGVQSRIIKPDIGTILNIGHVHAENIGSIEKIYNGKKELSDFLLKNNLPVVLNSDDKWLRKIIEINDPNIITYGYNSKEFTIKKTDVDSDGLKFMFIHSNKEYEVSIPVYVESLSYNALTSIILAGLVGVDIGDAIKALKEYKAPPGRFEIKEFNGTTIINDAYNANPTSMEMSLKTFNKIFPSNEFQRIVILGDMKELGAVASQKHQKIGDLVKKLQFTDVYYIGEYFNDFNYGKKLSNWEEAKEIVDKHISFKENTAILLKASHSIGLYKILPD